MALTKLPKNAFATGSVDDSKIEDGTIQAVEVSGTITEDKIATGTIANASLSNSSITINGTSISLGGSSSVGVDVNWQSVQTTGFTAVAGNGYFVDTTSGAITVTLPASATLGDQIAIKDYAGTFASNNLTIGRNGHNIQGVANDSLISTNRASLLLVYVDSTKGWIYAEESNVADLQANTFISATGGTITTSGDFKIHTFTGDGCFAVSTIGAGPVGGPATVDYLVIAGGGGGGISGAGGGGAGGFRESKSGCAGCWSASPLATPTGITVTATTYPITVGAGGAAVSGGSKTGNQGSDSIFSSITSSGGGRGTNGGCGYAGGSGGGVTGANPGGAGNTPPVSPPQGNPGGTGATFIGSGGGGAGGPGGNAGGPTGPGGPGGNGITTSFNTSPTTRAGGGGGNNGQGSPNPGGSGGPGGGGAGGGLCQSGTNGTANTGSGGGGGFYNTTSGAGGKGIVIIRYKFQ